MRSGLAFIFSCFASLLIASEAKAHHEMGTPHVYATGWGVTLGDDGHGFYNDFAHFVLGDRKNADEYIVLPYRRAMRSFETDANGCVYPKSIDALVRSNSMADGDSYIESKALLRSPIRVFTPEGHRVITSDSELAGLRVAYALGSRIPKSVKAEGVDFIAVADEVNKAKILSSGTVDAMIANMPDAFFVFQSIGKDMPPFDPDYDPVPVPRIRIVCHDTGATRAFILRLNERIDALIQSGDLARFIESYDLPAGEYLP